MIEKQGWIRRQALNIASQLPQEQDHAREILALVEQLVGFFDERPASRNVWNDQAVVRFPGGPSSPKRRANSRVSPSGLPK